MRYLVFILLAAASAAASTPHAAFAQAPPEAAEYDIMTVPPGMVSVPVTARSLPAGISPDILLQQNAASAAPVAQAPVMDEANTTFVIEPQSVPEAITSLPPAPETKPKPATEEKASKNAKTETPATLATPCTGHCAMPLKISHGITYATGGTTEAEIEQLKKWENDFNLQLLFAANNGDHLTIHRVRLMRKNKEVLSISPAGPYIYARMSPGEYTLEVLYEAGMKPVKTTVKIPAKNHLRKTVILK